MADPLEIIGHFIPKLISDKSSRDSRIFFNPSYVGHVEIFYSLHLASIMLENKLFSSLGFLGTVKLFSLMFPSLESSFCLSSRLPYPLTYIIIVVESSMLMDASTIAYLKLTQVVWPSQSSWIHTWSLPWWPIWKKIKCIVVYLLRILGSHTSHQGSNMFHCYVCTLL